MSENSKIEWCDHTFNPWIGCTKVSPGCANCYAEELMDKRYDRVNWGKGNPRSRTSQANWKKPVQWDRKAKREGIRPRVFCASLADWLDPEVPIEWLAEMLDTIRRTPHLDWLLLAKRPELWRDRLSEASAYSGAIGSSGDDFDVTCGWINYWLNGYVPYTQNVWIGTSVEDQKRADERIPALIKIPAKVRFLSCEPLLGPVDLIYWTHVSENGIGLPRTRHSAGIENCIHWLIVGGESGSKARPMNPDWARSLRDQCQEAEVAFFFKQMGGVRKPFAPIPDDLMIREFPEVSR